MVNDDSRFQEYELAVVILFFKEHFITVNTGTTGRDVYVVLFELCRLHFRQLGSTVVTVRMVPYVKVRYGITKSSSQSHS